MSVKSFEKLEKSMVALTIEVGADEFEAAIVKAYQKLRNQVNVQGFRPGKAPRKIIETRYGAEFFYDEAVNIVLPDAYEAAVEEKELDVVGYPKVELVGEVTKDGFTFTAQTAVYPDVKLGAYRDLQAEKPEVKVTAADVDNRIQELTDRNTRLVSVTRAVAQGDTAVIDFEGFDKGVAFEGGKGENFNLEIGSGQFIPGFEEQLVGMSAGEEKDIDITFPEDYHADLAGKAVVFHVKVNEVKVKEVPALDDEFAKDVSEFDTLVELKADLEKKVIAEREETANRAFEENLMSLVAQNIECDVPDAMVNNQAEKFLENFKSQLQQQGIPYEQYLQMTGMEESKLKEDAKEPALRQVRLDLAIAAIIEEEKLEVSDEEIEAEYKTLSEKYGMELDLVKKYLSTDQIRAQVLNEKAIQLVRSTAVAVAPAPVEETVALEPEEVKEVKAKKPAAKKPAAKKTAKKDDAKKTEEAK
ncbi:MAG: trigger factor [Oscillospiraceae bacterium]